VGPREHLSWREGFVGRWLIPPDDKNRWGSDGRVFYGVGLTRSGHIVVYRCPIRDGWPRRLVFYDHLEDVASAESWRSSEALGTIIAGLGDDQVIWRDV
jgi:hypothetical protein